MFLVPAPIVVLWKLSNHLSGLLEVIGTGHTLTFGPLSIRSIAITQPVSLDVFVKVSVQFQVGISFQCVGSFDVFYHYVGIINY